MKNSLNPTVLRTVNQCNFNKFNGSVHADRILDEHCMFYVLEGEWEIWQDDEPYTVKKDDMIFLMRGHHHYGRKPSSPVIRTCFIHPAADAADRMIEDTESAAVQPGDTLPFVFNTLIHCQSNPAVKGLFEKIIQLYYSDDPYKSEEISGNFLLLFAQLAKMNISGEHCPQIVTDVIDLINRTPHKFFTLQELADSVYVCPKTLSSQFKSNTGMTIHKYQTDLKMKMASSLLNSSPNITLKELAKHFGYYDEFHFSRVYKQYFGRTPKSKKS